VATLEIAFLNNQLEERKRRLEAAMALSTQKAGLAGLLREVDSALERMAEGTFGICQECHESIEQDRLLTDPLVCYCLDHLTPPQRDALQRDLDLAAQVQRNLLPRTGLTAGGWETSYHYAPFGPVSGDYCDLIPFDGQLFFVLGDVSGKGVAASMLMAQLHALFRSLTGLALPLGRMVALACAARPTRRAGWHGSTLSIQRPVVIGSPPMTSGQSRSNSSRTWLRARSMIAASRPDVRKRASRSRPKVWAAARNVHAEATSFQVSGIPELICVELCQHTPDGNVSSCAMTSSPNRPSCCGATRTLRASRTPCCTPA